MDPTQNLFGRTKEIKMPSAMIASLQVDIWTCDILNKKEAYD